MKHFLLLTLCLITSLTHSKNPSLSEEMADHFKQAVKTATIDKAKRNAIIFHRQYERCIERKAIDKQTGDNCLHVLNAEVDQFLGDNIKALATLVPVAIASTIMTSSLLRQVGAQEIAKGVATASEVVGGLATAANIADLAGAFIVRSNIQSALKGALK